MLLQDTLFNLDRYNRVGGQIGNLEFFLDHFQSIFDKFVFY